MWLAYRIREATAVDAFRLEEFHPSSSSTSATGSSEGQGRQGDSSLLLMLTEDPFRLQKSESQLFLPLNREAIHPLWNTLKLIAWPISGDPMMQQGIH